jgi:hypothetical protein
MKVIVMYREGLDKYPKEIEISDKCPQCGGNRGKPYGFNFYEDGDWFFVNCWKNPCGHVDYYPDVIKEAESSPKKEKESEGK